MKTKRFFPIYILILISVTVLYLFLAVKPLAKEYQFSPVWKINSSNPSVEDNISGDKMYFRLNNTLGYFTNEGKISLYKLYDNKASISDNYYAVYNSQAENTPFYDNTGKECGTLKACGFPYFQDDLIFVFLPGGCSIAKCDMLGNVVWSYEGTLPITAFSAKKRYTAIGFANGLIKIFDTETGTLQLSYAPGGSDFPVILGLDISDDGQYIASVSGHEKQRFVLSKREGTQQKIIYHNYLESNIPVRTLVHFCEDNNRVLYNYKDNLGIYNISSDKNDVISIKDKIISIEEGENLIYLLSKNKKNYTVTILENTNAVEGSFNFEADSAFIKTENNNLYIGKDNSISCIAVTRE